MWKNINFFSALTRNQKEAVGLLQIGTILEYFDLMLYVHMAIILNALFFPETDPHTAALLSAFAFCSTYVLRPFGALLFGYIGDHIGRKTTVIITTMMMSISCIVMATLPTYAQIGITAAWLVTICRVLQGISSMGEIIGAEIYMTEITKPPVRYPAVALMGCAAKIGIMAALGVATLATSYGFNWRNAFWIGAIVALVGSTARVRLRETPDFVDMKRRMKIAMEESEGAGLGRAADLLTKIDPKNETKVSWKTTLAFFAIYSAPPMCLYFTFIHCGNLLKDLGYSGEYIIKQNFIISIIELLGIIITAFMSYRIYPLKIIKFKAWLFLPFVIMSPYMMKVAHTSYDIFLIQLISVIVILTPVPAVSVLFAHFPVLRRFTYTSFIYALTRALMYVATSFGVVYLVDFFGFWGMWFILVPVTVSFIWGVHYFEKLDMQPALKREHLMDQAEDIASANSPQQVPIS